MALTILNISSTSLDFGTVVVGGHYDIDITISNQSSPSEAISGNVGNPEDDTHYSIVSGGGDYTLSNDGDDKTITVRFSPVSAGTIETTIPITNDCGNPTSPTAVHLTGYSYSSSYELPVISNLPCGDVRCLISVDSSVPELTIPSGVRIISVGDITERIDIDLAGVVEVDNLAIQISDDYAVYPNGFWFNLLQLYPDKDVHFLFTVEEDGNDTFLFRGRVDRKNTQWREHYISGSDVIRSVDMTLISSIEYLKTANVADICTEAKLHKTEPQSTTLSELITVRLVKIMDVFAAMVSVCYDQTFSSSDAILQDCDFIFSRYSPEGDSTLDNCYVVESSSGTAGLSLLSNNTSQDSAWVTKYENGYDLLTALVKTFGLIPRYSYGQTDGTVLFDGSDRHRITFYSRGENYALKTSISKLKESLFTCEISLKGNNIRVEEKLSNTILGWKTVNIDGSEKKQYCTPGHSDWVYNGSTGLTNNEDASPVEPPLHSSFDIEVEAELETIDLTPFAAGGTTPLTDNWYRLTGMLPKMLWIISSGYAIQLEKVKYYNHQSDSYSSYGERYTVALRDYLYARFDPIRKQYDRTYGTISATYNGTASQLNMKPLMLHDINSGIETVTYYATEVRKNIMTNTTSVKWVEL